MTRCTPLPVSPLRYAGSVDTERLALAGLHLGDPAEVQCGAAHHLDVVVALADRALGGLATDGERLEQEVVEVGAVVEPLAELVGLGLERVVGQRADLGFEGVDVGHHALQRLDLLAFTGAEDAIEDSHAAVHPTGATRPDGSGDERRSSRRGTAAVGAAAGAAGRCGGDRVQPRLDDAGVTQRSRRGAQRGPGGDDVVDDDDPTSVEARTGDELGAVEPLDARSGRSGCTVGPDRTSSRRHGTPSWRAT